MPTPKDLITLQDITLHSPDHTLDGVTIEVSEGSQFAVLGPPQSGKTLFVKALAGLAAVEQGSGYLLNYALGDPRITTNEQIGFLHQRANWHGGLTVAELLQLQMRQYRTQDSLADLAALAGLEASQHITAEALSAGERQRLGLIMMHIQNPRLLILDDPVWRLTDIERKPVLDLVGRISVGRTLVFTTSSLADVTTLATHVALLYQGTILAYGPVDTILSNPAFSIFSVVLRGDTSVVYEHIHNLAWIKDIQVSSEGSTTVWTISMLEGEATPTSLLRAIMADRSLHIVQFRQLRPRIDQLLTALDQPSLTANNGLVGY